MVDAKAHLLTVQTKTMTAVDAKAHLRLHLWQRHLQRPSVNKKCDNATMVDAQAHLHLQLPAS